MQASSRPHHPQISPHDQHLALLTLHDIEEIESLERSKQHAGIPLTDEEVALTLFARDALASFTIERDRIMAQRLQEMENGLDMPVMNADLNRRQSSTGSTGPSEAPARVGVQPSALTSTSRPHAVGRQDSFDHSVRWVYDNVVGWLFKSGEASGSGVPNQASERLTGHDCVICGDPIQGVEIVTPCNHYYDKQCIIALFRASCKDETLYPPRCCKQPIPLDTVQSFLTVAALQLFEEKGREFNTLKRVYCSTPSCSRFLGPQTHRLVFNSFLTCSDCRAQTCGHCKGRVDPTRFHHTCIPEDERQSEVLALGAQQNWARCPGCTQLIELSFGCFHITCRCKTEFCYLCKASWKTCMCTQWDENRLYAAAEERVDAQLRNRAPVAAPQQAAVLPEIVQARRLTQRPLPTPPTAQRVVFPEIIPSRRSNPITRSTLTTQRRPETSPVKGETQSLSNPGQASQPPTYPIIFPEVVPTRRRTESSLRVGTVTDSRTLRQEPTILDIPASSSRTSTSDTIKPDTSRRASTSRSTLTPRQSSTSLSLGQSWLATRSFDHDASQELESISSSASTSSIASTKSNSSLRVSSTTASNRIRRLTHPAPYPPSFVSKIATATTTEPSSSLSNGRSKPLPSPLKSLRSIGSLSSLSSFLKNGLPSPSSPSSTHSASTSSSLSSSHPKSLTALRNRRSIISIPTLGHGRLPSTAPSSPQASKSLRRHSQPERLPLYHLEEGEDSNTGADELVREQLIYEMMEVLRINHGCDHIERWRYHDGAGRCENCQNWLPKYLYVCSGCQLRACNRCRRNRL